MKTIITLIALMLTNTAFANIEMVPSHKFTDEQIKWMVEKNKETALRDAKLSAFSRRSNLGGYDNISPYAEYEDQGYLIFSSETNFKSGYAKELFLENLPENIIPVIFTQNQSPEYVNSLKETWGVFLSNPDKLKVIALNQYGVGFWARDGLPVPAFHTNKNGTKDFVVVDSKYYHNFEPDQKVADLFFAKNLSHDYYTEGGNFIANKLGDCFIVENQRTAVMPDSIFTEYYGCKTLIRFPFVTGIGHIDEVVKFVSDKLVLTDIKSYVPTLEEAGFEVVMLPRAVGYETYANSITLNNTVYVPVFDRPTDEEALNVYRSVGLYPIPMNSSILSNRGLGSLHCISMVYPPVDFNELLTSFGAKEVK